MDVEVDVDVDTNVNWIFVRSLHVDREDCLFLCLQIWIVELEQNILSSHYFCIGYKCTTT